MTLLPEADRIAVDWIAVDWGTSNLRIWALDAQGSTLAHRSSARGMITLERDGFEPALLELIDDLLPAGRATPVIMCGMAGARQGWAEAPYRAVPCPPPSLQTATQAPSRDPRLDIRILPGIKQTDPADVMRGEETQINGFLAGQPGHSGTLCLPGTHTKWVRLEAGQVTRFRTCMTGELFALLSGQSVLRHSVAAKGFDWSAFAAAVAAMAEAPEALATDLFSIRAAGLVADLEPEAARGRLSGLLIGAEIAAIRRDFPLNTVTLLGTDHIAKAYQGALAQLGFEARPLDAEATTLNGLALAYSTYQKEAS